MQQDLATLFQMFLPGQPLWPQVQFCQQLFYFYLHSVVHKVGPVQREQLLFWQQPQRFERFCLHSVVHTGEPEQSWLLLPRLLFVFVCTQPNWHQSLLLVFDIRFLAQQHL